MVLRRLSSGAFVSLDGLSEGCLSMEMECGEITAAQQSVFVGMAALRSLSLREAWDVYGQSNVKKFPSKFNSSLGCTHHHNTLRLTYQD